MKLIKSMLTALLAVAILLFSTVMVYRLFPLRHLNLIRAYSEEMGVDKYLVTALIKAESNFNSDAVSSANAKGVMQLTDETARFCASLLEMEYQGDEIYNPEVNIKLGVCYLKRMLDLFNHNEELAIAAYNAGEGRVTSWLNDPNLSSDGKNLDKIPYEETRLHVEKIAQYKKIYKLLYPNI